MSSNRGCCAMAVMAKAPQLGRVKTRLCPPLLPQDATMLSKAFLKDITGNIRAASETTAIRPFVAFAPSGAEDLFNDVVAEGTDLVLADGSADVADSVGGFGRCLLHAVESLLGAEFSAVCLLNSDSPTIPTAILIHAANLLLSRKRDVVLGPAYDGGYYLIGMTEPHPRLFEGINWSTDSVLSETRSRIAELSLDAEEMVMWYDVDDQEALRRLVDEVRSPPFLPSGHVPFAAPATTALLAELKAAAPFFLLQ